MYDKTTLWNAPQGHLGSSSSRQFMVPFLENGERSDYLASLWLGKTNLDLLTTLPLSEDVEVRLVQLAAIKKFETYLENQQEGIVNYHEYKMKGYIVGSGFIEKRNDVLIKNRMVRQKRMRWSLVGGEAMMQLLVAQMNGRLDELFV